MRVPKHRSLAWAFNGGRTLRDSQPSGSKTLLRTQAMTAPVADCREALADKLAGACFYVLRDQMADVCNELLWNGNTPCALVSNSR